MQGLWLWDLIEGTLCFFNSFWWWGYHYPSPNGSVLEKRQTLQWKWNIRSTATNPSGTLQHSGSGREKRKKKQTAKVSANIKTGRLCDLYHRYSCWFRDDSSEGEVEEENEPDLETYAMEVGRVVCVEASDKKRNKDNWFPGLVVMPSAQPTVRINAKDEFLVRSFKDGR